VKILHLGKYYPPFFGGIENFMFAHITRQLDESHDVMAIVHQHDPQIKHFQIDSSNCEVWRVPVQKNIAYAPISLGFPIRLKQAIKSFRPDIIHVHMPNLSAFSCILPFMSGTAKIVIHWHSDVLGANPNTLVKRLYPLYQVLERLLLKKADAIVVTSEPYLQSSEPLLDFRDKCHVIPLGIKALPKEGLKPSISNLNSLNLLFVGRLSYYKGLSNLIEAIRDVDNVILRIVGTGELERDLRKLVEDYQLSKQVQFLGKVSDQALVKELSNADLLCLPSIERTEAFGMVLLEAMRASKPCLVTDVPGSGMNWVVQDGQTGFVVEHNSIERIQGLLRRLIEDKSCLTDMGANARKRFEEYFTIEQVSREIDGLYQSLIAKD
jgi:rhamnosyl/mannosyltransferase